METKPKPPGKNATQEEQDAYAQSLLRMVNIDYQKQQAEKPQVHHMLSKKWVIALAVGLVLSIVLGWVLSSTTKQTNYPVDTFDTINSAGNQ